MPDQVLVGPDGLLDGGIGVPKVYLVEVDVIGLQPHQAVLHLSHDV